MRLVPRGLLVALLVLVAACGGPPPRAAPPITIDDEPEEAGEATPPPPPGPARDGWDFAHAKAALTRMYVDHGPRRDLYCGCPFAPVGHGLSVDLGACGYVVAHDATRAARVEWEHAVPASVFGRTFDAWTSGDPRCRSKGKPYRGRKCAQKVSRAFARIEGDMHNLFPVVGEVNAERADLPMGMGTGGVRDPWHPDRGGKAARSVTFGACGTRIVAGALSPRPEIRGDLARAYAYMARTYPDRVVIDEAHRAMFDAWDRDDPPDDWERERSRLIKAIQGTENPFVTRPR